MAFKHKPLFFLFLLVFLSLTLFFVECSSLESDSETLLKFKSSLSNVSPLESWDSKTTPCSENSANWVGVLCNKGNIWGLQLENLGLTGTVDMNILKDLKDLRTLSFMRNNLEGPLPDLKKIEGLKSVYFSHNRLSGEIPKDAFEGISSLKKVYLADNNFMGAIPSSLASLPKLMELRLDGNKFEGQIPDFQANELQIFNVSNNALTGSIPSSLSKLDPSSFSGNKDLCGGPLPNACDGTESKLNPKQEASGNPTTPSSDSGTDKSDSTLIIVIVSVVSLVVLAAMIATVFIVRRRRERKAGESVEAPTPSNLQKKSGIRESEQAALGSTEMTGGGKKNESTKLSFVRDDREKFDLQDLLKASAEILGSGCFGSSYKAALTSGAMMVVKRFKQMNNVGKEEFQEHMRRLGRLRHANLLPLVAYYYRKEEKLLVSDFVENGSLAVHLHGYQALGQPSLDWPSRLKVVKGVAKGLAYLYKELPSLIAPHGHLKSSNILLNESYEPLLTDYGLIPVINQESAQELMVAYKSPESLQHSRITKKTDVWGLGILILEILTGKFPANFLQQGKKSEADLASWVHSVVINGESNGEVFDKDMGGTKNSEGEMNKLLKIGLACCEAEVEKRLDLKEVVERIEELKEKDGDDDFFSSYASEADVRSSRGKSDEFCFS